MSSNADTNINEYAHIMKSLMNDDLSVYSMLRVIKSYDSPPDVEGDPYCLRDPWHKIGGVSSGICMTWCWYSDSYILEKASVKDIVTAYNEITKEHRRNTYDDDSNKD